MPDRLSKRPRHLEVNEGLYQYLIKCQMPDGGFCSFHEPESGAGFSNVADTYFALDCFRLLPEKPQDLQKTAGWIQQVLEADGMYRRVPYLSWCLLSKIRLRLSLDFQEREALKTESIRLMREEVQENEWASLVRDLAFLMNVRLEGNLAPHSAEREQVGTFLRKAIAVKLEKTILELADLLFLSQFYPDVRDMLPDEGRYRHPEWGYVLVPGSSRSDLFIILAGYGLRKDSLNSEEKSSIRQRVLFCQETNGGFGPVGGALPTLEASHAAMKLLHLLEG